jgi:hypothetical protein
MMSPGTQAKANAIRVGLSMATLDICNLLAMLTSSLKEERERAKGVVRGLVASAERRRIELEQANGLQQFANRHEPRP